MASARTGLLKNAFRYDTASDVPQLWKLIWKLMYDIQTAGMQMRAQLML